MKEEFGIMVIVLNVLGTYQIMAPALSQKKIPGVSFLCELKISEQGGSDSIKLNTKEYSQYKWITEKQVRNLDLVDGVKADIRAALKMLIDK